MKSISLVSGAAAVLFFCGSSLASDHSVKPAWSGFYVGGQAGGAQGISGFERRYFGNTAPVVTTPGFDLRVDNRISSEISSLYGAQIGFNYQLSSLFVAGLKSIFQK
jgi:hypothetical protein